MRAENGYEAILCHCPTDQGGKLDHLFIPERRARLCHGQPLAPDAVPGPEEHPHRPLPPPRRAGRQRAGGLVPPHGRRAGAKDLRRANAAKAVHDELERYYVHATDFAAVDALRGRVERELFA